MCVCASLRFRPGSLWKATFSSRDWSRSSPELLVSNKGSMILLEAEHIFKRFKAGGLFRHEGLLAVNDVSLTLSQGETLGIVGESGSGKSTLLRMILRLIRPTSGRIIYKGRDLWALGGQEMLGIRRDVQAIFQDPASSFNPRQRIGTILRAPLDVHRIGTPKDREVKVAETLTRVGLPPDFVRRFPHQLSGGQRQRVAIGRAIIMGPTLVLADEPTSALDVSVQAQILNLFRETSRDLGLSSIFVSHNLAVIRYLSDRVAVMKQGKIVESGPSETVFANPQHPYTRALLEAVPDPRRHWLKTAQTVAEKPINA
jgi:ABC-type oligopeptide transport system ATPase subunit